jgi:hypothetical protein
VTIWRPLASMPHSTGAALVAFGAVARRAFDVVRFPLAMIRSPAFRVVVRLGGVSKPPCRAALCLLLLGIFLVYSVNEDPSI